MQITIGNLLGFSFVLVLLMRWGGLVGNFWASLAVVIALGFAVARNYVPKGKITKVIAIGWFSLFVVMPFLHLSFTKRFPAMSESLEKRRIGLDVGLASSIWPDNIEVRTAFSGFCRMLELEHGKQMRGEIENIDVEGLIGERKYRVLADKLKALHRDDKFVERLMDRCEGEQSWVQVGETLRSKLEMESPLGGREWYRLCGALVLGAALFRVALALFSPKSLPRAFTMFALVLALFLFLDSALPWTTSGRLRIMPYSLAACSAKIEEAKKLGHDKISCDFAIGPMQQAGPLLFPPNTLVQFLRSECADGSRGCGFDSRVYNPYYGMYAVVYEEGVKEPPLLGPYGPILTSETFSGKPVYLRAPAEAGVMTYRMNIQLSS